MPQIYATPTASQMAINLLLENNWDAIKGQVNYVTPTATMLIAPLSKTHSPTLTDILASKSPSVQAPNGNCATSPTLTDILAPYTANTDNPMDPPAAAEPIILSPIPNVEPTNIASPTAIFVAQTAAAVVSLASTDPEQAAQALLALQSEKMNVHQTIPQKKSHPEYTPLEVVRDVLKRPHMYSDEDFAALLNGDMKDCNQQYVPRIGRFINKVLHIVADEYNIPLRDLMMLCGTMEMYTCMAIKADKQPCGATAQAGFCFCAQHRSEYSRKEGTYMFRKRVRGQELEGDIAQWAVGDKKSKSADSSRDFLM